MCGIAGFIDRSRCAGSYDLADTARRMADAIAHRGPDDSGVWVDWAAGLAFSHRRLSIMDLSAAGHQPMVSGCGRFVINYNGEVYNHAEIRSRLVGRGIQFKGHSDTEVILESCAAFGILSTLESLIGMFALAVWDRKTRTLTIARDRLGIKPVYWAKFGDLFIFSSELKALRAHAGWTKELDRASAAAFLRYGYVPAPASILRGVHKLEPGCVLTLREGGAPEIARFWDAGKVIFNALNSRFELSDAEATDRLEHLLMDAVGRRLVADVPLGAFLSGGIDSPTVVALMQVHTNRQVRTFSIGFREGGIDEAPHAKALAKHLRTDHTELYVEAADAMAIIPRLPDIYDEPFADSSQIPTFLVSEMTRRHVTVALSGDGGDELFSCYNPYVFAASIWSKMQRLPLTLRKVTAGAIGAITPRTWDRLFKWVPQHLRTSQPGDKMKKISTVMALNDPDAFYRTLASQWLTPDALVVDGREYRGILWDATVKDRVPDFVERMQYFDLVTYLPDDILTKLDRASMAVGLEARVPLLDHRIVEFAFRLPARFKRRNGTSKWLLRQVLDRYIPKTLLNRPKMGFTVPIDVWLRGPLREWAQALLEPFRLKSEGLLNPTPIALAWREHLAGQRNWQHQLWAVLMLQAWREKWM